MAPRRVEVDARRAGDAERVEPGCAEGLSVIRDLADVHVEVEGTVRWCEG